MISGGIEAAGFQSLSSKERAAYGDLLGETSESEVAGMASAELLVNLTSHDVVLACQFPEDPAEHTGGGSLVRVPPGGSFARVDDDAATIGGELLATRSGVFSLTHLRWNGRLVDLPAPRAGTRYLVSRLTALAARDRTDLAFPFGEVREDDGKIACALGLGAFVPDRGRSGVSRKRRAADIRLASRPVDKQWLISALFAAATLFVGAAAGALPGALDEARGSHGSWSTWSMWLTAGFRAAGTALLAIAVWRWSRGGKIRRLRGTAYIVYEEAERWRPEDKQIVLAEIGAGFDKVLEILGPRELGFDWYWRAAGHTAPQWDRRVEELVSSFRAVHHTDDHGTPNAVFVWAPWPVAMAFGARASARGRNVPLNVRQRPSNAGTRGRQPRLTDVAHDFLGTRNEPSLQVVAPSLVAAHLPGAVTVTVRPLGAPDRDHGGHVRGGSHRATVRDNPYSLLLLVVRITHGPVGPIDIELGRTGAFELEVAESLAVHSLPPGPQPIPVAEWRLEAQDAGPGRAPGELPWAAFPSAIAEIAGWVAGQAAAHQAKVVLLATRMPQELGVGLGIQLRQRSWDLAAGHRWPERMYPAIYAGDSRRLIVPDLRLGADSVPSQQA